MTYVKEGGPYVRDSHLLESIKPKTEVEQDLHLFTFGHRTCIVLVCEVIWFYVKGLFKKGPCGIFPKT